MYGTTVAPIGVCSEYFQEAPFVGGQLIGETNLSINPPSVWRVLFVLHSLEIFVDRNNVADYSFLAEPLVVHFSDLEAK